MHTSSRRHVCVVLYSFVTDHTRQKQKSPQQLCAGLHPLRCIAFAVHVRMRPQHKCVDTDRHIRGRFVCAPAIYANIIHTYVHTDTVYILKYTYYYTNIHKRMHMHTLTKANPTCPQTHTHGPITWSSRCSHTFDDLEH